MTKQKIKGFVEHDLGTCDQKHPSEFIKEQTVGETISMVIEAMWQCQKSWVVQPRDMIVSHQIECMKLHQSRPFCRIGKNTIY